MIIVWGCICLCIPVYRGSSLTWNSSCIIFYFICWSRFYETDFSFEHRTPGMADSLNLRFNDFTVFSLGGLQSSWGDCVCSGAQICGYHTSVLRVLSNNPSSHFQGLSFSRFSLCHVKNHIFINVRNVSCLNFLYKLGVWSNLIYKKEREKESERVKERRREHRT